MCTLEEEKARYRQAAKAVCAIPKSLYDKALRWQLQQLKQGPKEEWQAPETDFWGPQDGPEAAEAEPLTDAERALLLTRDDDVGQALADIHGLTEAERYALLGWPQPSEMQRNIERATAAELSRPWQLVAKGERLIEETKAALEKQGGRAARYLAARPTDALRLARPFAPLLDEELDLLAWKFSPKRGTYGGNIVDIWERIHAPGLAQAEELVTTAEGVNYRTRVFAMDEVHQRQDEKRPTAEDEAAGLIIRRPSAPGPFLDALPAIASSIERLVEQWRPDLETALPSGSGRREPLSDEVFAQELRLCTSALRAYQHHPSRPVMISTVAIGPGLPSDIVVAKSGQTAGQARQVSQGGTGMPVPARTKMDYLPPLAKPWSREEDLGRSLGWPPDAPRRIKPFILFMLEAHKKGQGKPNHIDGSSMLYDDWEELSPEERDVYVEQADQMRKEAWRAHLKNLGIEFGQ